MSQNVSLLLLPFVCFFFLFLILPLPAPPPPLSFNQVSLEFAVYSMLAENFASWLLGLLTCANRLHTCQVPFWMVQESQGCLPKLSVAGVDRLSTYFEGKHSQCLIDKEMYLML